VLRHDSLSIFRGQVGRDHSCASEQAPDDEEHSQKAEKEEFSVAFHIRIVTGGYRKTSRQKQYTRLLVWRQTNQVIMDMYPARRSFSHPPRCAAERTLCPCLPGGPIRRPPKSMQMRKPRPKKDAGWRCIEPAWARYGWYRLDAGSAQRGGRDSNIIPFRGPAADANTAPKRTRYIEVSSPLGLDMTDAGLLPAQLSGEGGSSSQCGAPEPILLAPGTTVKEALLIIHFRLDAKGDLDSMW